MAAQLSPVSRPVFVTRHPVLCAMAALGLMLGSWICLDLQAAPHWVSLAFAAAASLLAGVTYSFQMRPTPGKLRRWGKDQVIVGSLDDWTTYQYGCAFEEASPEQKSEAIGHYRVGMRLFPLKGEEPLAPRPWPSLLLSFVMFSAYMMLASAASGWYRLALFVSFYGWIYLRMRISKKFENAPRSQILDLGL